VCIFSGGVYKTSEQAFSTLALDILGQIILYVGDCPVHCRMFSPSPGLNTKCQKHPPPPPSVTKYILTLPQCPLGGGENCPQLRTTSVENWRIPERSQDWWAQDTWEALLLLRNFCKAVTVWHKVKSCSQNLEVRAGAGVIGESAVLCSALAPWAPLLLCWWCFWLFLPCFMWGNGLTVLMPRFLEHLCVRCCAKQKVLSFHLHPSPVTGATVISGLKPRLS
jgi:hypothetical protein